MIPREGIAIGFKYFRAKNLKGRPDIKTQQQHDEMLDIWSEGLNDINPHVFVAACKSLSDELIFYPSFAEVRKRCLELVNGKRPEANEIWSKIKRKMLAACHSYANPSDFDNSLNAIKCPVARETAASFDWHTYGLSDEKNESYHKLQFEKLYNAIRDRLAVVNEAERLGLAAPAPVLELLGMLPENFRKGMFEAVAGNTIKPRADLIIQKKLD